MAKSHLFLSRIAAGLLLSGTLLFGSGMVGASAEAASAGLAEQLGQRIERLEGQVRSAFKLKPGTPVPPAHIPAGQPVRLAQSSQAVGALSVRVDRLENQMRRLNGHIEELNFQIRSLQEEMRRIQKDNEFRFQDLEKGRGKKRKRSALPKPGVKTGTLAPKPVQGAATLGQPVALSSTGPVVVGQANIPTTLPKPAGQAGLGKGPVDLQALAKGLRKDPTLTPGGDTFALAADVSPDEAYSQAYSYVVAGDYALAEVSLNQFIETYPKSEYISNARFWLGESLLVQKRPKEAAQAFLKGFEANSNGPKAPEFLYKLGIALAEMGEKTPACASFAEFKKRFPKAPRMTRNKVASAAKQYHC